MRSNPHAIVRNGKDVIATFKSFTLAEEAFYDLGCYLDESPAVDDIFEIVAVSEFLLRDENTTSH